MRPSSDPRPGEDHDDVPSTADRWASMPVSRRVLFVARTLQATARLAFDVAPLIAEDTRIQHCYVLDPTSRFGGAVPPFLGALRPVVLTWDEAVAAPPFDLIVSAGVNANLAELPGPVLTMSHGAGHHKLRATADGDDGTVSGLSPHQLVGDDGVIPRVLALGGPQQRDDLAEQCPEALDRATVTGDVCFDRLRRNRHHRDMHRRRLGVRPHQRLVVLTSTWGPDSLLAAAPDLAARLLGELPADEYRVAAVAHPNFWESHGDPQVRGWHGPATRSGLALVPALEGWRAAILAADVVVGDHGSVIFYAAAMGIPVAYGRFAGSETPPGSPAADLADAAPHLDLESPLERQIDAVVAGHDPDKYLVITRRSIADLDASTLLRSVLYREIDLPEPVDEPTIAAFPDLEPPPAAPTVHHVYIQDGRTELRARRFPANATANGRREDAEARVLVVDVREPNADRWRVASILLSTGEAFTLAEADEWAAATMRAWTSCPVTAAELADGTLFVRFRDGRRRVASAHGLDAATVAASIHFAMSGGAPTALRVRTGSRLTSVEVREAPRLSFGEW